MLKRTYTASSDSKISGTRWLLNDPRSPTSEFGRLIGTVGVVLLLACGSDDKAAPEADSGDQAPGENQSVVPAGLRDAASSFFASYAATGGGWRAVTDDPAIPLAEHLRNALQMEVAETRRFADVIAGLDFDPFYGSQDPCESYTVGAIVAQAGGYEVAVHGDCATEDPHVIVTFEEIDGVFQLANVSYPSLDSDLTSMLNGLAESRR